MKTYKVQMPDTWEPAKCSERTHKGWIIICPITCFDRSFNQRFYTGACPLSTAVEVNDEGGLCEKYGHKTEDLVVLADKKGWMGSVGISERPSGWRIAFSNGNVFFGKTYQEAETEARKELNKLLDV